MLARPARNARDRAHAISAAGVLSMVQQIGNASGVAVIGTVYFGPAESHDVRIAVIVCLACSSPRALSSRCCCANASHPRCKVCARTPPSSKILPGPFHSAALFKTRMSARTAADRAVLPHLGNHTRAILTSEYTMTVKIMIGLAAVATDRNNDACIRQSRQGTNARVRDGSRTHPELGLRNYPTAAYWWTRGQLHSSRRTR
jgi:hypothetical protein